MEVKTLLRDELLKSIFPIIQLNEQTERYDIAGTAVLLQYKKLTFLVTASHVLKRNGEKYPLYLCLEDENIKLTGPAFIEDDDNEDLAIFDLRTDTNLKNSLKNYIALKLVETTENLSTNINHLVYGFPFRRSHFDKETSIFSIKPIIYITKEVQNNVYSELKVDENDFRVVDYNQKKSKNEKGEKTTVGNPQGASGGGLIKIYSNEKQELVSFEFDGILIEWRKKKYIVATRTQKVIDTIEKRIRS